MLHESEARTNLIADSDTFGSWAATAVTKTLNTTETVDPAGTQTALKVEATHSARAGLYRSRIPVTAGNSLSLYAKIGTGRWIALSNESSTIGWAYFDLVDGVVGDFNSCEPFIEDAGNGWYRIGLNNSQYSNSLGTYFLISLVSGTAASNPWSTGLSNSGDIVYLWGPQLEQAPTASSYIPTSGATVTRAAESLTIPAANLPWPTPEVIGDELVTNGGFDTDSDWTKGTGWTIGSGVASCDGTQTTQTILSTATSPATVSGTVYRLSIDATVSAGSLAVTYVGTGVTEISGITADGTYEAIFVSGGTNTLQISANSSFVGTIDNISVKEINPLAVSIQMDGRMTYADDDQTIFAAWSATGVDLIQIALQDSVDRLRFRQAIGGVFDDVLQSPITSYSPGVFVPFNIASRHGSTFVNGAVDGVALTADTTPTALPDLSATDLNLGYDFMGTIRNFQIWDRDIGDTGLVDETAPSLEPSLFLTFDGTTGSYTVTDWSE
jgi:hypothetical protein